MAQRPSLKTVADAVGVSPSTVSNAYNRPEHLSAALRERIFDVAAHLGYAGPDPAARSLRSRRAGAVGVLFAVDLPYAFSDPYCSELLTGIADVAEAWRCGVLLMPVGPHTTSCEYSVEEERLSVQAVRSAVIDGAILDGVDDRHPALRVLTDRGIPLVRSIDADGGRCVVLDEEGAGRAIGSHLRGLGHRQVVLIGDSTDDAPPRSGPSDDSTLLPYAHQRLAGVREGLGPDAHVAVLPAGRNTVDFGRESARVALARPDPPTAIVATSDVLAMGVVDVLHERGLAVGRDVSVTGFDNTRQGREAGLTTVSQPVRDKGRVMARMLLDPAFTETRVLLPTELVVRSSTAPVRQIDGNTRNSNEKGSDR